MSWCDPCAADPMSAGELDELGADWGGKSDNLANRLQPLGAGGTFVTRLHVRHDAKTFPEDLNFIETGDRENFQGRYVLQYPSTVNSSCSLATAYRASLPARFRQQAEKLSDVTGWPKLEIEERMAATGQPLAAAK